MFKFFDLGSECFAKYDAFCSHAFDLSLSKRLKIMEKLYTSKTFLKMAGGRIHTPQPHPTPLDPTLATSYRNHQISLVYFSHLAPLVFFVLLKSRVKKRSMNNAPPSKYASAVKSKKGLLVLKCPVKK